MGSICSHTAEVAPIPKNSIIFKYTYKTVEFENVNGDIPNQYVDAIGALLEMNLYHQNLQKRIKCESQRVLEKRLEQWIPNFSPDLKRGINIDFFCPQGVKEKFFMFFSSVIQMESDKLIEDTEHGYLDVSTAVTTTGGKLKAKYVIHVVSPIWSGGVNEEDIKLANAMNNVLTEANDKGVVSIAIPYLSGGGFGFPKEKGVNVIIQSCLEFIDKNPETSIKLIKFVNLDAPIVKEFKAQLEKLKGESVETETRQEDL